MRVRIKNRRGIALVVTLCFLIVGAIGAAAFMYLVKTEILQVKRQSHSLKAFFTAEAGLDKGIEVLKTDLYYTPGESKPSWADGTLYTTEGPIDLEPYGYPKCLDPVNPDYEGQFYTIIPETDYKVEGNGNHKSTYEVELSNLEGWTDRVWVKSTGRYYEKDKSGSYVPDAKRTILSLVGAMDVSPWGYAIFANTGQNGLVVNGNVDIRGSVHILGDDLGPNDLAAEFSGSGRIGNNYDGIPPELDLKIPSIQKTYGTETLDSLETTVAIKNGKLSLSGTSYVGSPDVQGNGIKETVTGVYITDGYTGNQGSRNVYSDNDTDNSYILGDFDVEFPWLTKPWGGYSNYLEEYIRLNAFVISGEKYPELPWVNGVLTIDPNIRFAPTGNLSPSETPNSISMSEGGILNIEGMILVDGDVVLEKAGNEKAIVYTGKRTLTAAKTPDGAGGNVTIECNLVTFPDDTFPKYDFLGVMAEDTITFNSAGINVMGVFYAENKIVSQKQTNVAGSFVSNYFDMGQNVPAIFQVPETTYNLPPGMIGSVHIWAIKKITWSEI